MGSKMNALEFSWGETRATEKGWRRGQLWEGKEKYMKHVQTEINISDQERGVSIPSPGGW